MCVDYRNNQKNGIPAIAQFLTKMGNEEDLTEAIGFARWNVTADAGPAPKDGGQHVVRMTLMFGECPFEWWGCPSKRQGSESTFETTRRWAAYRNRAANSIVSRVIM